MLNVTPKFRQKLLAVGLATTLLFGSIAGVGGLGVHQAEAANVTSFTYTDASNWNTVVTGLSAGASTSSFNTGHLAVSMDGSKVAYNDTKDVFIYDNTTKASKLIYTTDTAVNPTDAVISDDGLSVVFYRGQDLIVWKESTGPKVVFTTTGSFSGQLTLSSDASVIGFANSVSGTPLQYAIYTESDGAVKQMTANQATGGTKNTVSRNLGSTPTVISPDGNTAYLSYYWDTYSNANYIAFYNIASGTVTATYQDSAENVHPHGISRDGKYLYGMAYYFSTNNFQIRDVTNYVASKKVLGTGLAANQIGDYNSNGSYISSVNTVVSNGTSNTPILSKIGQGHKRGFSGDGKIIYGITNGNLYRIDLSEIISHLPDVGLPTPPTASLISATRTGVQIKYESNSSMATSTFQVFRNGVSVYTGTGLSYNDTSGNIGENYVYTVKVRGINGEYSSISNEIVAGKPEGVPTKLGISTLKAGDYVNFGPYKWRLIGDDRLMAAESYITRIYDVTNSLDQLFGTKYDSNIGTYLNDVVYSLFSDEEQQAMKMTTWTITAKGSKFPLKVTKAKIGLLTSDEYNDLNLPYFPPTGWTLTPNSNSTTPNSFYTNASSTSSISNSTAFYPVINLTAGVNVLSGEGTVDNPYVVSTGELTTLDKPSNLKLKTVTSAEIELTWNSVVNATEYDVYRGDKVIGTSTTNAYKGPAGETGKEHVYTVVAKTSKLTSDPSEALKVITPEEVKPPVTDPGTTDPGTNPGDTGSSISKPTNFRLIGKTETTATLAWSVEEGMSYKLSKDGIVLYEGTTEGKFTATGLSPSSSNSFELIKIKEDKSSEPVVVDVTTNAEHVDYPMGLTVSEATYQGVTLNWIPVDGVTSYDITHMGQVIDSVTSPPFTDLNPVPGAVNYYGVIAVKGNAVSKESKKSVYVAGPTVESPGKPTGLRAVRIYHDQVSLEVGFDSNATEYKFFRDGNILIAKGPLTAVVDMGVAPSTSYNYKVVAVNSSGEVESDTITVTTPAQPKPIPVYATEPQMGEVSFDIEVVDWAQAFGVARNPEVMYVANGDGTFAKTWYNSVTDETTNLGNVTPVDGKIKFTETGVQAGKDYTYKVTAYTKSASGEFEEAGSNEQTVTTPADGSGATVPGTTTPTDPGNGGGTTNPGTGNGGTTDPGAGGGNTPTNPGTGNGGTTPTNPGTDNSGTTPGGGNSTGGSSNGSGGSGSTITPPINTVEPTKPSTDTNIIPGVIVPDGSTVGSEENGSQNSNDSKTDSPKFTDVKETHFAYDSINRLASEGIVKGYTDGSFGVDKVVSRAEFAIMIKRALSLEDGSRIKKEFYDYDSESWYGTELATAYNAGITKGFTDHAYRPNISIPREQAAEMLFNVAKEKISPKDVKITLKDFTHVSKWASPAVKFTLNAGILKGYPDNTIKPYNDITRGEAAVLIDRMLLLINK